MGTQTAEGDGSLGTPTYPDTFPGPFCVALGYWHTTDRRESITLMPASIPSLHLCLAPTTYVSCKKENTYCPVPGLCIVTGKDQGIRGCWKLQFR